MQITAIGGGSFEDTRSISDLVLAQSAAKDPLLLFIPTASGDSEDYIDRFHTEFRDRGVRTDVLRLHSGEEPNKISKADVIYVGGGNTKMMIQLWKSTGVDRLLHEFVFDAKKPVMGLSAGAICWFREGNSDWPRFEGIEGVNTAPVEGLNWVDLAYCPHVHAEPFRFDEFNAMMEKTPGVGVGITDGAALQIVDEGYRILSSLPTGHGYRVVAGHAERLDAHDDFRPLADLLRSKV